MDLEMSKPTLLIVAHGSRRQASNDEVRALADQLRTMNKAEIGDVQVAFLELAEPSIPDALSECVRLGAQEIIVFPYFLAAGTHVATDIPEEIAGFCEKHPQVKVSLTPHVGAAPTLPHAILEVALAGQTQPA
jgi:sirohydrochlorin ferrochelatase